MRIRSSSSLLAVFAVLGVACNKGPANDSDGPPPPECDGVSWSTHAEPFVSICTDCHSSTLEGPARNGAPDPLNFDPPDGVAGFANQMLAVGTDANGEPPTMPPTTAPRQPTTGQRDDFATWVDCGLPDLPMPETQACAGVTLPGPIRLSDLEIPLCDADPPVRWVEGDLVLDADPTAASCLCGVGGAIVGEPGAPAGPLVMPRLRRLDGGLLLEDSAITSVSLPGLEEAGTVHVVANAGLTRVDLPALLRAPRVRVRDNPLLLDVLVDSLAFVEGALIVRGNAALPVLDLSSLRGVQGIVDIRDNAGLVELVPPMGPAAPSQLPDALALVGHPSLGAVEGFGSLQTIAGGVRMEDLGATRVEAFPGLVATGSLQLVDLGALDRLHAFTALTTTTGSVRISDIGPVSSLDLLGSLQTVGGGLVVDGFREQAIVGFPSLVSVHGTIEIANGDVVNELRLPQLAEAGGLFVHDNAALPNLDGFQGLTAIPGNVEIVDNGALESLFGLQNLIEIGGGLRLEGLPLLDSLQGLQSLEVVHGDLLVRDTGLDPAALNAFVDGITVNGTITIE
jgi:hypothetical protein